MIKIRMNCAHGVSLAVALLVAALLTVALQRPANASDLAVPAVGDRLLQTDGASDAGSGPENALTPTGEQVTLDAGEWRWYTFEYASDSDGDTEPSEAIAELQMTEPGSIDFEVWTQDDIRRWRNGEDFSPTGAGTPAFTGEEDGTDQRNRSLLRWVGSGEATVQYYIIVQNQTDSQASYSLTVTGPTVSFIGPGDSTLDEPTATNAMTDTTTMTDTGTMTGTTSGDMASDDMSDTSAMLAGGTGPNDALTPSSGSRTLAAGERRWYTFRYNSDGDFDTEPEEVIAELQMSRPGALSFEVWSQDDLRRWQNREDFTPTGAGTPAFVIESGDNVDNRDRSLLRWVGGGEGTVDYYLIVENNSDSAASYRLSVTGSTVSFPAASGNTGMADSSAMTDT
ncbi:MAG: hypothetical protein KDE19_11310, partial [Caldilineaceae bacterium]|nr:hypothetical protein [Caldilineaceae bacterium]